MRPTNKAELVIKYWKNKSPGNEGIYNIRLIERAWEKDGDANKITKEELDSLLKEMQPNGK